MRRWAWTAFFLAVACAPPSLPTPARAPSEEEPFRVLSVSARGALDVAPEELTVVFTRAMHPIETPTADAPAIGRLERTTDHVAIAGSWAWFGSRTAVFRPAEARLPGATTFRLTIPAGTASLDGSRLPAAETAEFSTPRPRLTGVSYELDDSVPGSPRPHVNLVFNMPVRASEVERAVHLDGKRHGAPFQAPIRLVPEQDDPADSFSTLPDPALSSVDALAAIADVGLVSPTGPLGSEDMTRLEAGGPGPVTVKLDCADPDGPCDPDASVTLDLSKWTRSADLVAHLDPRPKTPHPLADLEEQVSSLDLGSLYPLRPRAKLKLTVRAGLVMADGDKLEQDRTLDVVMGDRRPLLRWDRLPYETVVEAARSVLDFAITSVNVPSFELACAPIDERDLFALVSNRPDGLAWIKARPGAVTREIRPGAATNADARQRAGIPAGMRPRSGFGLFAVGLFAPHNLGDGPHVLSVTDLGLTTKWGPYGGLVWVTRLSSGAPVARAGVSVTRIAAAGPRDAPAFTGTTDADGIVSLPRDLAIRLGEAEGLVVVREGEDMTFARLSTPRAAPPLGMLFTERRLYRPGDIVYAKGYFRIPGTQGAFESPAGQQVEVNLRIDSHSIHTERVTLDAFGAMSVALKLPPSKVGSAALQMQLVLPPGEHGATGWAYAGFSVADYRAVEFKVEAKADRATYVRDDVARLSISASYLFGAAMHDVPARYSFTRSRVAFAPPGVDGFSFGDDLFGRTPSVDPTGKGAVTLGADGRAEPGVKLELPDQRGTERVDVEVDVDDVGKAFTVTGRATGLIVQPGDFLLGVRIPGEPRVFAGDRLRVETVAVDASGARRPGVAVHVAFHKVVGSDRSVVAECDTTTGEALDRSCAFLAALPGTYGILATATDTRGNPLFASADVFVPNKSLRTEHPPPREARSAPLSFDERCARAQGGPTSIEAEDRAYAPGDSARVCVATAAPRALLTMEREGVLHHELLSVAPTIDGDRRLAKGPLAIAVTPDLEPDARVALHTVSARRGPVPVREQGSLRPIGTSVDTALRVARPDKRLVVTIAPHPTLAAAGPRTPAGPTAFQPGDDVDVDLTVVDGRGKPARAQVTFFAVDEGVNLLAPYRMPHPDVFWEARGDKVGTKDTRDQLYWDPILGGAHRTRAPSIRQGSTSVSGDFRGAGRKTFVPTAAFRPAILTGADGRATVHFTLPHNTTTWKLYAVAADDADGFGTAEGEIVASQWFIARPALPRFLRAGDRAAVGVVIDSAVEGPASADLSFSVSGAAAGHRDIPVALRGLDHVPLGFDVTAERAGRATVKLSLVGTSGGIGRPVRDAVELDLPVREPWALETVAFAGETRARATEALSLNGRRKDAGWLEYRLAATPLVALGEGIEQLLEYPYGCTEQLVSRLVPLVALQGISARLGLALPSDASAKALLAVRAILSHQRYDGGFGAWEGSTENAWLTSYALWGLSVSRDAGLDVPQGAIDRAFAFLDAQHATARAEDLAFAEDVRVAHDHARPEHLKALEARTALSVEARALLAHAEARLDPTVARSLLDAIPLRTSGATATVAPGEHERSFPGSTAQATALVLRAFVAVDPKNAIVPSLARGLLSLRRAGRWATTQDAAWALLALADVGATADASPRDFVVRLGGQVVDRSQLPPSSLVAHTGALAMGTVVNKPSLSFESVSGAPLFYEAYLRSTPAAPPTTALAHGLQIDRTYRVIGADGTVHPGSIHVGDYVLVDLYVTSATPREQVVVDDPLPAGLEPVTGAFATEARGATLRESSYNHREFRDERVLTFVDRLGAETRHFAYRAHATTAGVFHTPAARAECMYAPDLFGRTDAPTVTIAAAGSGSAP